MWPASRRLGALAIACLALLCGLVAGDLVEHQTQVTVYQDPALTPEAPPDGPLDQPPLARTVTGMQPEGIHASPWQLARDGTWTLLLSWQTGEARTGPTGAAPPPHDPDSVASVVRYGDRPGALDSEVVGGKRAVYKYVYGEDAGNTTYQSPILHHVLLPGLRPGSTLHYSVGSPGGGFSPELALRVPGGTAAFPFRLGVAGDPGQSNVTVEVVGQLAASEPDAVLLVGDLAYADQFFSNGTQTSQSYNSDQRRWDAWARLMQPLSSAVPTLVIHGNHELEQQLDNGNATFVAYNARYPTPQNPAELSTAPNYAGAYLNTSGDPRQFIDSPTAQPNNTYYSVRLPGAHLIALSNYLPYGPGSRQLDWFRAELARVDRAATPWLLVAIHAAPLNTYVGTFKQVDDLMAAYEPLFYEAGVDMVLSGHTHAYERSTPVYQRNVDDCGPQYITIGNAGTMDGMSNTVVDTDLQPYCQNASLYTTPWYQPTASGQPLLTYQGGAFCPTEQPAYSAWREMTYGWGTLTLLNATHAEWGYQRVYDPPGEPADFVAIRRNPACPYGAPLPAPTPAPAPAAGSPVAASAAVAPGLGQLAEYAAALLAAAALVV